VGGEKMFKGGRKRCGRMEGERCGSMEGKTYWVGGERCGRVGSEWRREDV